MWYKSLLVSIFCCLMALNACKTQQTASIEEPEKRVDKGEDEFQEHLDRKAAEWRGKAAPDFKLSALDGTSLSLADLKGKVILLNFWFSACTPCQTEVSSLNELQSKYGGNGFVVIGASLDNAELCQKFATEKKTKYQIAPNAKALAATYKVTTYPTSFLIDKNGLVQEVFIGASDFDATYTYSQVKPYLEKLLK